MSICHEFDECPMLLLRIESEIPKPTWKHAIKNREADAIQKSLDFCTKLIYHCSIVEHDNNPNHQKILCPSVTNKIKTKQMSNSKLTNKLSKKHTKKRNPKKNKKMSK